MIASRVAFKDASSDSEIPNPGMSTETRILSEGTSWFSVKILFVSCHFFFFFLPELAAHPGTEKIG